MKTIKKSFLVLIATVLFGLVSTIDAQEVKTDKKEAFNLNKSLAKEGYIRLILKKMPSGHLHLSGLINGVKGNFILDTGATGTVIEIKNKKKFKMQSQASERQASGAGGSSIQMQASSKNSFEIGKFKLENMNFMLMSLDHVNNAFEARGLKIIDGIIGADILTSQKAIIDYVNLSVYLKV